MKLLRNLLQDHREQTTARRQLEAPYQWWRRTRATIYVIVLVAAAIAITTGAGTSQAVLYCLCIALGILTIQMMVFGYLADEQIKWPRRRLMTIPLAILFVATGVTFVCVAAVTSTWTSLFPAAITLAIGGWHLVSDARSSIARIRAQANQHNTAQRSFDEGRGQGVLYATTNSPEGAPATPVASVPSFAFRRSLF